MVTPHRKDLQLRLPGCLLIGSALMLAVAYGDHMTGVEISFSM
ncbi:MAG: hypothetical protein PHU21_00630 [Elusimicrobia bacterium]|nr:hypothetical protein [Elusimicrobiota bacterium]